MQIETRIDDLILWFVWFVGINIHTRKQINIDKNANMDNVLTSLFFQFLTDKEFKNRVEGVILYTLLLHDTLTRKLEHLP